MNITDELRKYAQSWRETPYLMDDLDAGDIDGLLGDIEHIADRIDAEHQKSEDEWRDKNGDMWLKGYAACHEELMEGHPVIVADLENAGWVRLPVDADGVPIRVGDEMVLQHEVAEKPYVVQSLTWDGEDWYFTCDEGLFNACGWEHHHAPTVEDVLREFASVGIHIAAKHGIKAGEFDFYADEEAIAEYAAKLRLAESE